MHEAETDPTPPHLLSPRFSDVLFLLFAGYLDVFSALRLAAGCSSLRQCAPICRILERNLFVRVDKLDGFLGYIGRVLARLAPGDPEPRVKHLHLRLVAPASQQAKSEAKFDPLKHLADTLPSVLVHPTIKDHLQSLHFHGISIRPTSLAWVAARQHFPFSSHINEAKCLTRIALWDPKPVKSSPRNVTEEDLFADPPDPQPDELPPLAFEGLESFGRLERVKRVEVVFKDNFAALDFWKL